MDEATLLGFLLEANRHGYAAGRNAAKVREVDGSTTIVYDNGDWTFHDNYFGGEPYWGREVVFLKGRPVWMAVYYGWVEGASVDAERVYAFLQHALREAPAAFPVRAQTIHSPKTTPATARIRRSSFAPGLATATHSTTWSGAIRCESTTSRSACFTIRRTRRTQRRRSRLRP